ncbi:unnamed protein product [Prorocentrum cordatum]|uniref:PCIF1 WW domain-containing protein n=1 Tax=Prorocentrum cordatum TaxID=2364126 RepID=A0ABN9WXV1_9DINO|nr:unnamed protein product [Polarella glacialis]
MLGQYLADVARRRGVQMLAALQWSDPRLGRDGSVRLPAARQSFRRWMALTPLLTRLPSAGELAAALARELVGQGQLGAAAGAARSRGFCMRLGMWPRVLARHAVPPRAGRSPALRCRALAPHPREGHAAGFDARLVLDPSRSRDQWLAGVPRRLSAEKGPDASLFAASGGRLSEQISRLPPVMLKRALRGHNALPKVLLWSRGAPPFQATGGNVGPSPRPLRRAADVWRALARYQGTVFGASGEGAGWQLASPTLAMRGLEDEFQCAHECFASPFNCHFGSFCSLFPDTDWWFGSCGNFFSPDLRCLVRASRVFAPTEGSFEAGPPYEVGVLDAMAAKVLGALAEAEGAGRRLSWAFVLPDWHSGGIDALRRSPLARAEVVLGTGEHTYKERPAAPVRGQARPRRVRDADPAALGADGRCVRGLAAHSARGRPRRRRLARGAGPADLDRQVRRRAQARKQIRALSTGGRRE